MLVCFAKKQKNKTCIVSYIDSLLVRERK